MMPPTTTGVACRLAGAGKREHPLRREPRDGRSCRSASASCSGCRAGSPLYVGQSAPDDTSRTRSPARRSRWTRLSSVSTCRSSNPSAISCPSSCFPSVVCTCSADHGRGLGPALDRPQERDERGQFRLAEVAWRHPLQRDPFMDQRGELLGVPRGQALDESAVPFRRRCRRRHGTGRTGSRIPSVLRPSSAPPRSRQSSPGSEHQARGFRLI